jgi:hypothetical protein
MLAKGKRLAGPIAPANAFSGPLRLTSENFAARSKLDQALVPFVIGA